MDEISVKDVLLSVGENINPARDIVGSGDLKTDTVEFILSKTYFENLGILMQDYLTTTSVGDLIRKARGVTASPSVPAPSTSAPGAESVRDSGVDLEPRGWNIGDTRDLS
jgi:Rrf2 family iron-sulfur cluster assembly transcriptional regulator